MGAEKYPIDFVRAETEAIGFAPEFNEEATGPITIAVDRLVCVVGPDMGQTYPVRQQQMVIGRCDADIVLSGTDVSRRHARLVMSDAKLVIEDLGSSNGTYVNGTRITDRTRIEVGDHIQLGSTILVVSRHDELEERLKQLQKLEAMGALVKGLAHDFNNLLTVMQTGLDDLDEVDGTRESRLVAVSELKDATDSAAALVRRLMRVGRNKPRTCDLILLESLCEETKPLLRRALPETIELVVEPAPFAMIRGSREELRHVLLNLVLNARDAMPNGGRVTISSTTVALDRSTALSMHLPHEGTYVQLTVVDTGVGMDETVLARIFEPYFTTKPAGKGNGLGLAMAFSAIRSHEGAISAESTPLQGTTFRILLPTGN